MFYVVEVGNTELFVELTLVGVKSLGIKPRFEVTAGTDWEGNDIYLNGVDEAKAIAYVIKHHHDEVYV